MTLEFSALLWLHMVGVAGWLGSTMVYGLLIGPTLPSLSPASRSELIVRLLPRYVRYGQIFALITPLFGVSLMLFISNGSLSIFEPTNTFSTFILLGAVWTLVGWVILFGVLTPTAGKVVRLTRQITGEGPPPQELQSSFRTLRTAAILGMLVLFFVVACMVYAAT